MNAKRMALAGAGIVAVAGLAVGAATLANASGTSSASTGFAANAGYGGGYGLGGPNGMNGNGDRGGAPNGNTDPSKPMRSDEQLLTGDVAAKVTAAAKAKEPHATIQRVETDSDGVYEAHMVRSDGTLITVQIDKDFNVTNVQVMLQRGQGGQGGPGGMGRHGGGSGGGGYGQTPNGTSTPSTTPSSTT